MPTGTPFTINRQVSTHKIHGTAGIYGLEEVGRIAAAIEQEMAAIKKIEKWTPGCRTRVSGIANISLFELLRETFLSTD